MSSVVLYFGFSLAFLVAGVFTDNVVAYGFCMMFLGFGVASLVTAMDARKRDARAALREENARHK